MTTDLVQRLRTCSAEERRAVAIELAKTGSNDAVAELIRMIEGKHRRGFKWYNLDDQLIGVETLSETGNKNALNYLKEVYETVNETTENKEVLLHDGGHAPESDVWGTKTYGHYSFPKARGQIAKSLKYSRLKSWPDYYGSDPQPSSDYRPQPSGTTHEVFRRAIAKLEKSLEK